MGKGSLEMEKIGKKDTFHLLIKTLKVTDKTLGSCGNKVVLFKTANAMAILVLSGILSWSHKALKTHLNVY